MTEQISYYLLSWYLREQTAQDICFIKPSLFKTHSPAMTVCQCVPQRKERKSTFQTKDLIRRQRNAKSMEKSFLNHTISNCITENRLNSYVLNSITSPQKKPKPLSPSLYSSNRHTVLH